MTEAAGKPERDILHDKRPHHDLIERILLEQHYAGKDTGYTLETADKIATKLAEAYSQSGAGPTRVEYRHHGGGGLCESHTGGPHKIEQGCKNWRPVASGAGSPEETKPSEPTPPPMYPCNDCGLLRTEAEGGKLFTLCDKCWDAEHERRRERRQERIAKCCGGAASSSQSAAPTAPTETKGMTAERECR